MTSVLFVSVRHSAHVSQHLKVFQILYEWLHCWSCRCARRAVDAISYTVKIERLVALILVLRSAETTYFRCLSVAQVLSCIVAFCDGNSVFGWSHNSVRWSRDAVCKQAPCQWCFALVGRCFGGGEVVFRVWHQTFGVWFLSRQVEERDIQSKVCVILRLSLYCLILCYWWVSRVLFLHLTYENRIWWFA